jgi:hypothetical protein
VGAKNPDAHAPQVDAVSAFEAALKVPASHLAHVVRLPLRYSPATQSTHTELPEGAAAPGTHATHVDDDDAPLSALKVPAGHDRHDEAGTTSAYVPDVHCVHALEPAGAT